MVDFSTNCPEALCPDFASVEYTAARQVFCSANITDAEATTILQKAWMANHLIERARQQRQAADAAAMASAEAAVETQRLLDEQVVQEAKKFADAEEAHPC